MLSSIPSNQPYANERDYILEIQGHRPWVADGVTTTRPVRGRSLNDKTGMDTTRHRGVAGFPRSTYPCRCQHRRRRPIYSFGDILGNIHAGVVAHIGHDTSGRHPADGGRIAGWAGCSICRRKVDTKYSFHPGSRSKVYYRLRVLIRQGDVLLWLTAFDKIAADILGTPASEYDSLDVSGRRKLVDSVVGLHFFINVKTVKSVFTNFYFAKINPARTKFFDAVLDSIKPTVR